MLLFVSPVSPFSPVSLAHAVSPILVTFSAGSATTISKGVILLLLENNPFEF
jgi:uncharacterized membrane protein YdjX (TVP38/TMEM64 family)